MIERKITFSNWAEFGLAKKVWEFDFEIKEPAIIGSIWIDNLFQTSQEKKQKTLCPERKDELKALIATAALKMQKEGRAVVVTNLESNAEVIEKFSKASGWGEVDVFYFADSKFLEKLNKLLKESVK